MLSRIGYIGTLLHTWINCKFVGQDENHNKYYVSRFCNGDGVHVRSVVYNKYEVDPTSIPPMWHAWLGYTIDDHPIKDKSVYKGKSPIERIKNPTGSCHAYYPNNTAEKSPQFWTPGAANTYNKKDG